jgi:ssDNA-binding Zn-finger/Zn-ribbon topoisomerase 1
MTTQRNQNFARGQAAQAASALSTLKAMLHRALSRGVCPECGGKLAPFGDENRRFLSCTEPSCPGLNAVVFKMECCRAEVAMK